MIHHYINLACWRPMPALYVAERDHVWIDSVSLRASVARLRPDAEYRPGTSTLDRIGPGTTEAGDWFFFTAGPVAQLPDDIQMALPFFEAITVPPDVAERLMALPANTRVGLGISAPKQNHLAAAMHALRPDLEYHCLGAAIAGYAPQGDSAVPALSGSGFEWLKFLIVSPKRTWSKIVTTVRELLAIRLHRPSQNDFARFAQICMPAPPQAPQNSTKGHER